MTEAVKPLAGNRIAPDGRRFPWCPVQHVHEVGPYAIVEYLQDKSKAPLSQQDGHGMTLFHPYIEGHDTCRSYHSLDEALVGCIAYRAEGPNGRADTYFCRMIGITKELTL